MDIISSRGEMKATGADVFVAGGRGIEKSTLCAKMTSSVAIVRSGAATAVVDWNTKIIDTANMWRPTSSTTSLYIPQTGWYLTNFYLTADPTNGRSPAHQATGQLWANRSGVYNYFGYNKREFQASTSSTYPSMISVTGLVYAKAGDVINVHWGTSAAVTSLTGEAWLGFGVWKVG